MSQISCQHIEQWILQSNNPVDAAQQWQATKMLQEWLSSTSQEPGDTVKPILVQLLTSPSSCEQVQFYALGTLERLQLNQQERSELRRYLLAEFRGRPSFLRNKAAMILKQHVLLDSRDAWSTVENDLLQLAQYDARLFCKTVETLLEAFVSDDNVDSAERASMRKMKDFLKGNDTPSPMKNGTSFLMRLFAATVQILSQNEGEIRLQAVQTVRHFFMWTELHFLGQDTVRHVLEALINSLANFKDAELQEASLLAWQELATSSSTNTKEQLSSIANVNDPKIAILTTLLGKIHEFNIIPYTGESNAEIEVVIQVAATVDSIGLEIAPLYNSGETNVIKTIFMQVLDLFFRSFAYDDIDVSLAVLPLANRLVGIMESEPDGVADGLRQHIPRLLMITYNQMMYPSDFSFEFEDDVDAEEEQYRVELGKLYSKLVLVASTTCLQFIIEAMARWLGNNGNSIPICEAPTPDVEAALQLLYKYCEGIRPSPGLKVVMRDEKFCSLLVALHQSTITRHQHREVLCRYYDVTVRYAPVFQKPDCSPLLATVFDALTGSQGLQHAHVRVRSRSCFLLLRLTKSVISLLRPYVETAVAGIQSLLTNNALDIRQDDTLYLFETIGLLLGKTGLSVEDQHRYLAGVMTPHVQMIKNTLADPSLRIDASQHGSVLSNAIAALTHLSKAFSRPAESIQMLLLETLQIAETVLEALPEVEEVRNKCMVHLQRMVVCIREKVLPLIPRFCQVLIEHCTADDILFVSQIFNQLCSKFGASGVPAIDSSLLPFLQKCHSIVTSQESEATALGSDLPPHLYTEQLATQKLSYSVLQFIVTHGATPVLWSSTNVGGLEQILQLMTNGAITVVDPQVRKTCLRFFRELLQVFVSTDEAMSTSSAPYQQGITQFCGQNLIPNFCQVLASQKLDVSDAMDARVISEFACLLSVWTRQVSPPMFDAAFVGLQLLCRLKPPSAGAGNERSVILEALQSEKTTEAWLHETLKA